MSVPDADRITEALHPAWFATRLRMLSNQRPAPSAASAFSEEKCSQATAAASHPPGLIADAVDEEKNISPFAG